MRVGSLLGSLPHLKYLVLEHTRLDFEHLQGDMKSWPRLHTMYWLKCTVLSSYVPDGPHGNLHSLVMWDCTPLFNGDDDDDISNSDLDIEDEDDRKERVMNGFASKLQGYISEAIVLLEEDKNPVGDLSISY